MGILREAVPSEVSWGREAGWGGGLPGTLVWARHPWDAVKRIVWVAFVGAVSVAMRDAHCCCDVWP